MPIRVLPDEVVSRIAAGEAVERPASAVKELVENAIDAGATSIYIEASGGGRRLLRVSDNGVGIRSDEIELAFARHATSKLQAAEELQALQTLGFRGEALSSLAAVSQAIIVSRHRDESMGVEIRSQAGTLRRRAVGAPAGTVVTVENLFYNTPARLKFLKNDSTEKRHIHWVVARYAMAYPSIAFVLKLDGRERLHSSGSGELGDVVAKAFGLDAFKNMAAVSSVDGARGGRVQIEVAGFTSLPSLSRARRDRIILFVNGRAIQDGALSHAVIQAYDGLLKTGAYPLAVLLISTPADFVDVNVHPTKAEVRFRDAHQVFLAVQRAVRESLQETDGNQLSTDLWSNSEFTDQYMEYARLQAPWKPSVGEQLFDEAGLGQIPELAEEPAKPRTLPVLRVVGQVGASYIVAEGPAGLYLVDQNAADERVLFESICEQLADGGLRTVIQAESETVLLSPEDAELLESIGELFSALGFEIEVFGPNAFLVRGLPKHASYFPAADLIPRMLAHLKTTECNLEDATVALAAAAARRRGKVMQDDDMRALIAKLERCQNPLSAPTGRRVLVHLSREQLADEFSRGG